MINNLFGPSFHRVSLLYLLFVIFLLLYSFTQIDLGLTVLRNPTVHSIQTAFQYIGYFQRPLSTAFFVILLLSFFIFFLVILRQINERKLGKKETWRLIILTSLILLFSYNAFSYDLFNYIFYAKIITYYHQNPYIHKALDYLGDPMLGFMHWTHNTYPYGPVWLLLTVPLSFLGFHFFWFTFFLFKALMILSFIGSCYFIEKIAQKFSQDSLFAVAFFAFNPLVLYEALVSSHNDIVMMFFVLAAFYYLFERKYVSSFFMLVVSILIKFATGFLLPLFIYKVIKDKSKKQLSFNTFARMTLFLMLVPIIFVTFRATFQPWYLLYLLPLAAFSGRTYYILIPTVIVSFFALLQYIPYLYTGNWNPPIPLILNELSITGIIFSFAATFFYKKVISK